jgi:hypothetical protein
MLITVSGTYNLQASFGYNSLQQNEIYLECDTSLAPVIINLPLISDLNGLLNIKIYVTDLSNNASINTISVIPALGNTINSSGVIVINSNGGSLSTAIVGLNKWIAYTSSSSPSVSTNISIPTPVIKIRQGTTSFGILSEQTVSASYLPFSDSIAETFKAHNPKFFLFRQCSSNKKPKGFYHPSHLGGINFPNSPVYGGSTRVPMSTEYDFGGITPYNYINLPFDAYNFVEFIPNILMPTYQPMTSADWNNPLINYRFTGKKRSKAVTPSGTKNAKSILFKIAIGIESPSGSTTNPILFGEFSDIFRLQFIVSYSSEIVIAKRFSIQMQTSSVTRRK